MVKINMGYLDIIKAKKDTEVVIKHSSRRDALTSQKGLCAKCKKNLNPMYSKFIKKEDGTYEVICSGCNVTIPKR